MNSSNHQPASLHGQIAAIRTEYKHLTLNESDVDSDPFKQFDRWWKEALQAEVEEINAMTLATASAEGIPDARIVLLKNITDDGFVFFTNYDSAKGQQLLSNPKAALVFFWKELERQVRVKGTVIKAGEALSDQYFASRPQGSRIGAWSSPQSKIISSREILEQNELEFKKKFGDNVPRPAHWGGFLVQPSHMEFWQGRPSRLHDRICYTKSENNWIITRLAP